MVQFERIPKSNIESSESPKNKEKEKSAKEIKEIKKEPGQKEKGITRREFLKWGAKVAGGILAEKMLPTEVIAGIIKNIETESHKELIKKINSINELIKKIEEAKTPYMKKKYEAKLMQTLMSRLTAIKPLLTRSMELRNRKISLRDLLKKYGK